MASPAPHILLVEDEPAQRELLAYNLEAEGFTVTQSDNGEDARLIVAETMPDLIVLDWMMPRLSGIELCRQLKMKQETKAIPVLMLSARSEEVDRVRGLETGADDYMTKPYSVVELIARVRGLLRRARPAVMGEELKFGEITLNTETYRVMRGDTEIKLGPKEFNLLATLMEKPGRVWSREQLLDRVWGLDRYLDTRTVDVHVGRVRKALGAPDVIRTVRGAGYALG